MGPAMQDRAVIERVVYFWTHGVHPSGRSHTLREVFAYAVRLGQEQERERAEARVAELEAALKPLAALAEKIGTKPKDESCWCGQDGAVIRFGDIRRARALLKEPDL